MEVLLGLGSETESKRVILLLYFIFLGIEKMILKNFLLDKKDETLLRKLKFKYRLASGASVIRKLIREQAQKEGLMK